MTDPGVLPNVLAPTGADADRLHETVRRTRTEAILKHEDVPVRLLASPSGDASAPPARSVVMRGKV
jgi:hypothetical protein